MQSLTLFFSLPGFTWEEVYWGTTITQNIAALVANARAKILATPAIIADVRITDTTKPHWAVYLTEGTFNGRGSYVDPAVPAGTTQSDRAYSIALVETLGAKNTISRRYFGGVPDSLVAEVAGGQTPGGLNPASAPAWQAALLDYTDVLATYNLGWLYRKYAGGQKVDTVLVNGSTIAPVGLVVDNPITIPALPSPSVLLKGFRSINTRIKNLGGVYYVSTETSLPAPPAGKFVYYLQGTTIQQGNNVLKIGQVFPWAEDLDTFTLSTLISFNSILTKATHRKRGVKELAPAGRSKIRR